MIPIPDLLHLEARETADTRILSELLGLAFGGRETDLAIDRALAATHETSPWEAEFFARDLFVEALVQDVCRLSIDGKQYAVNRAFLMRTLSSPPTDLGEIQFRQAICRELTENAGLRRAAQTLYANLYDLMNMFKVPGRQARLDIEAFRVDLFRLAKQAIDDMVRGFADATSGLRRLHEVGQQIQASEDYRVMAALVDYSDHRVTLNVDLQMGAGGRLRGLKLKGIQANDGNMFFRSGWAQRWDKLRFFFSYGVRLRDEDIVGRLVNAVFDKLGPSFSHLLQMLSHLELYLTNLSFKQRAEASGLDVCLATFDGEGDGDGHALEGLFNPLLLSHPRPPVPCHFEASGRDGITLLTGPNSGGKTRFLQAVGLCQLLAQGGLFTCARRARLSVLQGMFVSLIEHEAVEHAEGRLGRELERIRTMFDAMQPPSMVILDELCSGTNPSEATEVFSMVLQLLSPLAPVAFISTHFLDYAQQLESNPPIDNLDFLQVEMGPDQRSTYQFIPGVATSSMATAMAERMGVTFAELSQVLARRMDNR